MTARDALRTPAIVGRRPILVTGGAGFIGSNLVDALLERGDEVTVLDDLSTGKRENVESALAGAPSSWSSTSATPGPSPTSSSGSGRR